MKKHISIVSRLNKLKAFFIFWAEQRYGVLGSCQFEQKGGFSYCPGGSVHPHIDVLEAFDPNLAADPFRWIPKGLMQDLMDVQAELEMIAVKLDYLATQINTRSVL